MVHQVSPARAHFTSIQGPSDAKCTRFRCNYCSKVMADNTTRFTGHLAQCEATPPELRERMRQLARDRLSPLIKPDILGRATASALAANAGLASPLRSGTPPPRTGPPLSEESLRIARLLGLMLLSTNLPFNVIENEHFRAFVKALRPTYELPQPDELLRIIVDQIYASAAGPANPTPLSQNASQIINILTTNTFPATAGAATSAAAPGSPTAAPASAPAPLLTLPSPTTTSDTGSAALVQPAAPPSEPFKKPQ